MMDGIAKKLTFTNSEFALKTIRDRWPVILAQLIDSLCRNRDQYKVDLGENVSENLKTLIGHLSRLRYELTTNKPISVLNFVVSNDNELENWNKLLYDFNLYGNSKHFSNPHDSMSVCWYQIPWLFTECYLYRRIIDLVYESGLNNFDPFFVKKRHGFENSHVFNRMMIMFLSNVNDLSEKHFEIFLQASLWANEFDMSLHPNGEFFQKKSNNLSSYIEEFQEMLVVNDMELINAYCQNRLAFLSSTNPCKSKLLSIAIVLDNSGPELLADLCLAEYFIQSGLSDHVCFYGKCIPWFVSDVTKCDFDWLINKGLLDPSLQVDKTNCKDWSALWLERIRSGTFSFKTNAFWTMPFEYDKLATEDPDLYQELIQNDLVIFKGDLNYRKLVGDRQWQPDNPEHKVHAFRPVQFGVSSTYLNSCQCSDSSSKSIFPGNPDLCCTEAPLVVALRIAKADVAVGLDTEKYMNLCANNKDWWTCGKYGFVQIVSPVVMF